MASEKKYIYFSVVFEKELKKWLKENDTTKGYFAHKIGVRPEMIGRYLSGNTFPKADTLQRMADVFGIEKETFTIYERFKTEWEKEKADKLSKSGLSQAFIGLINQSGYNIEPCIITDDGENISQANALDNINFYDIHCDGTFVFSMKTDKLLNIQNEVIHYLSYLIKGESED